MLAMAGRSDKEAADFVQTLHRILSAGTHSDLVDWTPSGTCFVVKDTAQFATQILPLMFKHSNFQSFIRQLNKYDFHKVKTADAESLVSLGPQAAEFKHEQFIRGNTDNLSSVVRKKRGRNSSTQKPNSANVTHPTSSQTTLPAAALSTPTPPSSESLSSSASLPVNIPQQQTSASSSTQTQNLHPTNLSQLTMPNIQQMQQSHNSFLAYSLSDPSMVGILPIQDTYGHNLSSSSSNTSLSSFISTINPSSSASVTPRDTPALTSPHTIDPEEEEALNEEYDELYDQVIALTSMYKETIDALVLVRERQTLMSQESANLKEKLLVRDNIINELLKSQNQSEQFQQQVHAQEQQLQQHYQNSRNNSSSSNNTQSVHIPTQQNTIYRPPTPTHMTNNQTSIPSHLSQIQSSNTLYNNSTSGNGSNAPFYMTSQPFIHNIGELTANSPSLHTSHPASQNTNQKRKRGYDTLCEVANESNQRQGHGFPELATVSSSSSSSSSYLIGSNQNELQSLFQQLQNHRNEEHFSHQQQQQQQHQQNHETQQTSSTRVEPDGRLQNQHHQGQSQIVDMDSISMWAQLNSCHYP